MVWILQKSSFSVALEFSFLQEREISRLNRERDTTRICDEGFTFCLLEFDKELQSIERGRAKRWNDRQQRLSLDKHPSHYSRTETLLIEDVLLIHSYALF